MSRCLRDQTLLLLYEGEGSGAHRVHLQACSACATRYQRLVHDLEMIGRVLRESPLREAVPHHSRPFRVRWVAVAAVALALIWGGLWMRNPSPPVLPAEARNEAALFFLEEVAAALFSTADASAAVIPTPVSNFVYLQAALEGDWPCEWQEAFFNPECSDYSFSLFLGG